MRTCTKCKQSKEESEFYFNGVRLKSICKECEKAAQRARPRKSYYKKKEDPYSGSLRRKLENHEVILIECGSKEDMKAKQRAMASNACRYGIRIKTTSYTCVPYSTGEIIYVLKCQRENCDE